MNIRKFMNEKFGEIRAVEIKNKIWFIGKDVATALGYSNASKAVLTHCKHIRKEIIDVSSQNGNAHKSRKTQEMSLINEGDVYRLIVKSKLPSSEEFEIWLFDEVLPVMNSTGGYVMEGNELEFVQKYFPSFSNEVQLSMVTDLMKQNKEFKKKANWFDDFMNSKGTYSSTQIGKLFKIGSGQKMNKVLHENKIIYKQGSNWIPYETIDKSWYKLNVGTKNEHSYSQLKFTPKGVYELSKILNIEFDEEDLKELA